MVTYQCKVHFELIKKSMSGKKKKKKKMNGIQFKLQSRCSTGDENNMRQFCSGYIGIQQMSTRHNKIGSPLRK